MRSVLIYSLSRLALFAATTGVLFLVGARGFLLLGLAILISGVISFVLLSRQRDAVSNSVTERAGRIRDNMADGAAREDND
jgi:Protein of unknown function (DUF4229)